MVRNLNMENVCLICSKSFKFQSSLARHTTTTHNGLIVDCRCGATFTRRDNLKRHQKSSTCTPILSEPISAASQSESSVDSGYDDAPAISVNKHQSVQGQQKFGDSQ